MYKLHCAKNLVFLSPITTSKGLSTLEIELIDIRGFLLKQLILFYSSLSTFKLVNLVDSTDWCHECSGI